MKNLIKFRAWQPSANRWVYFHLPFRVGDCMPSNKEYTNFCQYISLLDINAKEIYKGDVFPIKSKGTGNIIGYARVKWSESESGWILSDNIHSGEYNIHWFAKNEQVIGNIFENKELLK